MAYYNGSRRQESAEACFIQICEACCVFWTPIYKVISFCWEGAVYYVIKPVCDNQYGENLWAFACFLLLCWSFYLVFCDMATFLYDAFGGVFEAVAFIYLGFYTTIFQTVDASYHGMSHNVDPRLSAFITGLGVITFVALVCFILQKINSTYFRPRFTVPFIALNTAVALKFDDVKQNNYIIPVCIVISALWLALSYYVVKRELYPPIPIRHYPRLTAAPRDNPIGPRSRPSVPNSTNLAIAEEGRLAPVYDAIKDGELLRIHSEGGHDHRLYVDANECSICMESFTETVRALLCGHCFHNSCIEKHFTTSPTHACPQCRQSATIAGWAVKSLFQ